jgi:hypothetical protein
MAYDLTWMPGVLRAAGLNVVEIGGWQNRGHGNMSDIRGVLLHHTAGSASGNYPSQNVVVNGRTGLPGPLCNLGLARDGTWIVVAAGLAYHAGTGYVSWCGRDNGNNHLIGVEAESTGRGDWTPAQLDSYPRGVAALLRYLGLGRDRALAHKEWAPSRKIDPAGWPGDMARFRTDVGIYIANPGYQQEEFFMALDEWKQERMFERVMSMAMGVENQNFDGPQFARERAEHAELRALVQGQGTLLAKLVENEDVTPEELEAAFASALAKERTALAAAIAGETSTYVIDNLRPMLLEVLGSDNAEQAEEIIRRMGEALANRPAA